MKSEERHDIETNELAKLFDKGRDQVGPYVSYIIYGLLAVGAIYGITRLTTGNMQAKQLEEWNTYIIATLPGRFDSEQVNLAAGEYSGTLVGELAQIARADSQLTAGCRNFFTNKKQAIKELNAALDEYKELATSAKDENLRGRAQLGVGKALEAKGEITEAIAAYEKVTGAFSEMADQRAEQLGDIQAATYADWLASAEGASRPTNFDRRSLPDFAADRLDLPGDDPATSGVDGGEDFLEMLKRFQDAAPDVSDGPDRYEEADAAAAEMANEAADVTPTDESLDAVEVADDPELQMEEVAEEAIDGKVEQPAKDATGSP